MDQNDPIFPDARHVNGTSVVGTTESPGVPVADPPADDRPQQADTSGLRPGFLSELASAMRATAERERETIAAKVADDAAAHIEKVRARAAIETEELTRLAEEDVDHIHEWAKGEIDRIRSEADERIADRRSSLDDYIKQHDAIIDREIEAVDAAVADYGATLDRFFAELAAVTDPREIVARAEALPTPPDLDGVRATARSGAVAMFAEPDGPAATPSDAASPARAESEVEAIGETGPIAAEASAELSPFDAAESSAAELTAAEAFAPPAIDQDGSNGAGEPEAIAASEPEPFAASEPEAFGASEPAPAMASSETAPVPGETDDSKVDAAPVPVMDPAATTDRTWPAPIPEPEPQPVASAPPVEHASAAVRLLRSVAPWTAPTHPTTEERSQND